jgi:hypothetical protein
LQAGDDVPDARTIWDFKQLLEKDGRDGTRRLFKQFGQLLRSEGLLAKEGSIVDASFVAAPRQRNSREQNAQIKQTQKPHTGALRTCLRTNEPDGDGSVTKLGFAHVDTTGVASLHGLFQKPFPISPSLSLSLSLTKCRP